MGKKIGLILAGSVLIGVFLAWMLAKGTDEAQAWIDPNPWLGFVAWGLALLCLLGGAALIARVVFRADAGRTDEVGPSR